MLHIVKLFDDMLYLPIIGVYDWGVRISSEHHRKHSTDEKLQFLLVANPDVDEWPCTQKCPPQHWTRGDQFINVGKFVWSSKKHHCHSSTKTFIIIIDLHNLSWLSFIISSSSSSERASVLKHMQLKAKIQSQNVHKAFLHANCGPTCIFSKWGSNCWKTVGR